MRAPGPRTSQKKVTKRLLLEENLQLKNETLQCRVAGENPLQSLLIRDHKKAEDKKAVGRKANKSKEPVEANEKKKDKGKSPSKSKDKKKNNKNGGKAKDVTKKEKASVGGQKRKVGKK